MGYVLSLPGVSTVVIGCQTPAEIDDNARIAREFVPLSPPQLCDLELRTQLNAAIIARYKRPD
jgi:predicted aldo/keto reductase-like oxidoreductase